MKKIQVNNKYLKYILILLSGLFLGWLFFHHPQKSVTTNESQVIEPVHKDEHGPIWTCAMHPQIRMDHPGKCPICGMDLIPLGQNDTSSIDPDALRMTPEAAELANVTTTVVSKQKPVKEIRLYGKVQADERLYQSIVAHVPGRIERLTVNFTGETIRKGQVLAEIYSPELITAQQELLETIKTKSIQPELYEASKEKLRQWKLTDDQINEIETSGKIMNNFKVISTASGTVTARRVNMGDHVSEGTVLYEIADLSRVWILFDAYESDLQFLSTGKKITFTLQALPGDEFSGRIAFIDPVIDPVTRVAKVRVESPNPSGRLKPEMFATGIVSSDLSRYSNDLVIPRSAVLWTGKRSIVYVKQPGTGGPIFKMREVTLGPALGQGYVVTEGLMEGEQIVTSGTFSVDASAQLAGKPSMMNPSRSISSSGHQHGEAAEQHLPAQVRSDTMVNFVQQLNTVTDRYLDLKNALVSGNPDQVQKEAIRVRDALLNVDMKLLTGESHNSWMEILKNLNGSVDKIASTGEIDKQRYAFSDLSNAMYTAIKTFGLRGRTIYYQFCPMARNNTGAFWLSETENIRNPYFGDKMLTCGETREVLKY
jgi:Cu(I)/Ag(I) efflux system membrane fusion protein